MLTARNALEIANQGWSEPVVKVPLDALPTAVDRRAKPLGIFYLRRCQRSTALLADHFYFPVVLREDFVDGSARRD
ncbi:MAG: hypothetical protein WAV76_09890 [Bacteroidota bacterium]